MKKILLSLAVIVLCSSGVLAQKQTKEDKTLRWQGGINASHLIGQLTGINNPSFARTTPYDLHFRFSKNGKTYTRFDFGYELPEPEAPSGAQEEGNAIDWTLHFRGGMGWNKTFHEKWVISTGPDFIYAMQNEKTFLDDELSSHLRTHVVGFGVSSNLQYFISNNFSIGVEMALYNSVRTQNQIFPEPAVNPTEPISIITDFFTEEPILQIRLYAPLELFAYYSF